MDGEKVGVDGRQVTGQLPAEKTEDPVAMVKAKNQTQHGQ